MLTIFATRQGQASVVTVPDDYTSIQAAIDAGPDTVLIREGNYLEVPEANRGVTLRGIGDRRPQLAGLAISNPYSFVSRHWDVSAINFSGQVAIATGNADLRYIEITFSDCTLQAGLQHVLFTDVDDISSISLLRCTLGAPCAARALSVIMESDTVDAGVRWDVAYDIRVWKCWFRGWWGPALYIGGDGTGGLVEENLLEECTTGIYGIGLHRMTIASNIIRRMVGNGIDIDGRSSIVRDNRIEECGTGIYGYQDQTELRNNTILRSRNDGMWFGLPYNLILEGNIVGLSGGAGVTVFASSLSALTFTHNTLFRNSGSGLDFPLSENNVIVVQSNIGYANGEWGARISESQQSIQVGCNDWIFNSLGSISGVDVRGQDVSLDPWFCDVDSGDVRLYSDSPLLSMPQCTQVGAQGMGCSPPTLKGLSVTSSPAGLGAMWDFEAASTVECWIERANQAADPWDSLGTGGSTGSNSFELLDRAVAPDRTYFYRVSWRDRGAVVHGPPVSATWSDAGRLSSVMPNPAVAQVNVGWVLSRPGLTDIRIFDLAGREVSIVARGTFGVGRHHARWDGRWEGRGIAPAGMYIVRISSGERTTSHRILLLR